MAAHARAPRRVDQRDAGGGASGCIGLWLLGLAAYLCYGGSWLGALLLAPAALHFYLGYVALQHDIEH